MFRSLTVWREPAVAGGAVDVTRIIDTVRSAGLIVVFVTVCLAKPHPSLDGGRGTAIAITLPTGITYWRVNSVYIVAEAGSFTTAAAMIAVVEKTLKEKKDRALRGAAVLAELTKPYLFRQRRP